jgi:uncharacterized protein
MPDSPLRTRESSTALDIWLHVQPRAGRNEIAGIHNGSLKLKVTAPPVDDAANEAILQFLAPRLDIPKSRLKILSGAKSRQKIVRIEGMSLQKFLSCFSQDQL